jgi:cytochrome c-type biogenesis protein CcmH
VSLADAPPPAAVRRRRRALLLLAGACLLAAAPAAGADEPSGWSYELWNELMSPFCPGRTLADCPSDRADSLRLWILVQESAGRSRQEVEAELLERYGDEILSAPRARGFGLTAYAVPIAVFGAGGVVVAIFLRRWKRRPALAAAGGAAVASDAELERAVDEDLAG